MVLDRVRRVGSRRLSALLATATGLLRPPDDADAARRPVLMESDPGRSSRHNDLGVDADAVSVDAIKHLQDDVFKLIAAASHSTGQAQLVVHDVAQEFARIRESISSLSQEGRKAAAASSSHATRTGAVAARSDAIAASLDITADGIADVGDAASRTTALLIDLQSFSAEIGGIVEAIASVASQTRMLALNATIEAARAGPAGRGFSVVAAEIKNLSDETRASADGIAQRVEGLAASAQASLAAIRLILETVEQVGPRFRTVRSGMAEQLRAVTELADDAMRTSCFIERVAGAFETIDQAAGKATLSLSVSNRAATEAVSAADDLGKRFFVAFRESAIGNRRVRRRFPAALPVTLHLPDGPLTVGSVDISLGGVRLSLPADCELSPPLDLHLSIDGVGDVEARIVGREGRTLRVCFLSSGTESRVRLEQLIGGLDLKYDALVTMVRDTASMINGAFVRAIRDGRLSEQELFDHAYLPIPGTNPCQYATSALPFYDETLPAIQEPVLAADPDIEFCAAVDINGWLPVHQLKYSLPQRPDDAAWNVANCRNRRIYDFRAGIFAARAMRPYMLQAYARDMGGPEPVMMASIDVPLQLLGRNWGGLRLGYRL